MAPGLCSDFLSCIKMCCCIFLTGMPSIDTCLTSILKISCLKSLVSLPYYRYDWLQWHFCSWISCTREGFSEHLICLRLNIWGDKASWVILCVPITSYCRTLRTLSVSALRLLLSAFPVSDSGVLPGPWGPSILSPLSGFCLNQFLRGLQSGSISCGTVLLHYWLVLFCKACFQS